MGGGVLEVLSRAELVVGGLMVAAFLALYWLVRGAPLGQAAPEEPDAEAPPAGVRDRAAAAAVGGLLLVALGAVVAAGWSIPGSLPLFALGFGAVIATIRVNRRHRHASPSLRRVTRFADAVLHGALLAGVLVVGNVLAFRYGGQPRDWTRERVYSLESQTVNLLRSLNRPVTFTLFSGEGGQAGRQLGRVAQLLDLYKAENPGRVRIRRVNPFDPVAFEALVKQVPDVAMAAGQGGGVVVELGEGPTADRVVVRSSELFEAAASDPYDPQAGRVESTFRGEDALSSALIRLREGTRPRIALTTGHGEPPDDELDPRRTGLGLLKARLGALGAEVFDLPLLREDVPSGTELVIVAAPRTAFAPEEVARLDAYMKGGGRVLAFLDDAATTGLEAWLKAYRIAPGAGLIVDPRYNTGGRPEMVVAPILGTENHPIVAPLRKQGVIVPHAAPLTIVAEPGPGAGAPAPNSVAVPILRTSPWSWAETDLKDPDLKRDEGKDTPGPLTVGVAVTVADAEPARATGLGAVPAPGTPRLVVFSSRYLPDNLFVANATNLDLVLNAVNWLRGRPELVGIAPKRHVALVLTADPNLRARLVWLPTLLAIALLVGLGVAAYLSRRA
ncbi:MAG TPA: GldG family protein [Isosphaeraceae bacterium]|jgi:hypothetical protein